MSQSTAASLMNDAPSSNEMMMFGAEMRRKFDDYVLGFALSQAEQGHRFVLVTLLKVEGSSPRPVGAQMAVSETGDWAGYLSGGCVERAVVSEALLALRDGKSRRVRFGKGSRYLDIQLPCGSGIDLFFDVSQPVAQLAALHQTLADRKAVEARYSAIAEDQMGEEIIRQSYFPRRRLLVAGIGVAALQLCRLAVLSGFEIALLSGDAATAHGVAMLNGRVYDFINPRKPPKLAIDRWTAVVCMFHDHELETQLLPILLDSDAFYVGALGSERTHQQRLANLKKRGYGDAALRRIHGPAGTFAGAKSASDIALSILAEIVQVERSSAPGRAIMPDDQSAYLYQENPV